MKFALLLRLAAVLLFAWPTYLSSPLSSLGVQKILAGPENSPTNGTIPGTIPGSDPGSSSTIYIPLVLGWIETTSSGARIFHVDGVNGDDSNIGSRDRPWRTLQHALDSIQGGDVVEIAGGIYRMSLIRFGPAGLGPDQMTVFRAAPGERVILTAPDDTPPQVHVADYVRLQGLWLGGRRTGDEGDKVFFGGSPIGRGKQFVNNTFFGYTELLQGSAEYILFQGNRFVLTGRGRFRHPLYLSGGYVEGSMSSHAIIDNNILIGREGWAIHGWHNARNNIVTRNFVAGHYWGIVMDGSDHVVANNVLWRQRGQPGREGPWGAWLPGANILAINNIFAHAPGIIATGPNVTVRDNAFLDSSPVGQGAVVLQPGQEAQALGVSEAEIDGAIAALEQAFSQPVERIYQDTTIEPAFAVLKLTIPEESPLFRQGKQWFAPGKASNLGPDTAAPNSVEAFWNAFRAQGMRDFDRFGQVVDATPEGE